MDEIQRATKLGLLLREFAVRRCDSYYVPTDVLRALGLERATEDYVDTGRAGAELLRRRRTG